jgi:hypothetical protein
MRFTSLSIKFEISLPFLFALIETLGELSRCSICKTCQSQAFIAFIDRNAISMIVEVCRSTDLPAYNINVITT